jgi:hypothetical protein
VGVGRPTDTAAAPLTVGGGRRSRSAATGNTDTGSANERSTRERLLGLTGRLVDVHLGIAPVRLSLPFPLSIPLALSVPIPIPLPLSLPILLPFPLSLTFTLPLPIAFSLSLSFEFSLPIGRVWRQGTTRRRREETRQGPYPTRAVRTGGHGRRSPVPSRCRTSVLQFSS